jgi:four helix bundle protein
MGTGYRDLKVRQMAMELVLDVYRCTRSFPREELYGLTSQIRRAVVSIPSNLAEGKGRFSRKEFLQYLFHARGSLLELETQIEIANRLGYLEDISHRRLARNAAEIGRMLNGLVATFQDRRLENQP